MRLLLDTHALLSALSAPDRLGPAARERIEDRRTVLLVSAASAWEIATKGRLGKLPGAEPLVDGWVDQLDRLGAEAAPITPRHALLAGSMRWAHRDPFDRMLAAQALIEDVPLVTADRAFADLAALRIIW